MYNLIKNFKPVCLYTYGIAHSRDSIVESAGKQMRDITIQYAADHFGVPHAHNKITMEVKDCYGISLFWSYWDGVCYIGRDIFFFDDPVLPGNEYKKVLPLVQKETA